MIKKKKKESCKKKKQVYIMQQSTVTVPTVFFSGVEIRTSNVFLSFSLSLLFLFFSVMDQSMTSQVPSVKLVLLGSIKIK